MKDAYPRWLHPHQTLDGFKRLVQNALEEETWTGIKMHPDGTPAEVDETPKPPTREEIEAAGYRGDVVESIFLQEQEKFAKGYKSYGPNENPSDAPAPPNPEVEETPVVNVAPEVEETPEVEATTKLEPAVDHAAVGESLGL